jgi:hypothetical protein
MYCDSNTIRPLLETHDALSIVHVYPGAQVTATSKARTEQIISPRKLPKKNDRLPSVCLDPTQSMIKERNAEDMATQMEKPAEE